MRARYTCWHERGNAGETETLQLHIGGMTCEHCGEKVECALSSVSGVLEAHASFSGGVANVRYAKGMVTPDALKAAVEGAGYTVLPAKNRSVLIILGTLAAIVALTVLLQAFGVLNYLAPDTLAESGMSLGMLFVIGLATSVHCIAMCGGINLTQSLPKEQSPPRKGVKAILPALMYNTGRVLSYTVIGLILGTVGWLAGGAGLEIPAVVQTIVKILAGILMVVMGVNMLGLIPWLKKLNPHLPRALSKKLRRSGVTQPFIVGILNGIMPCGPLQAMWLVALASGSPLTGALSMFLFALGTVPLMLGLGGIVAKLGQRFTRIVTGIGSVLVVVLGIAMLSQGGNLAGAPSPWIVPAVMLTLLAVGVLVSLPVERVRDRVLACTAAGVLAVGVGLFAAFDGFSGLGAKYDYAVVEGSIQTVTSRLLPGEYPDISVKKGVPVRWVVTAEDGDINGCNNRILIPEYGLEYTFHTGENIIEFTPQESGKYSYSCWMGMIYGTIRVE